MRSQVLTATAGLPCERNHSTCGGRNELCIGRGPAFQADDHGFKSNAIIAGRQAAKAQDLWQEQGPAVQDVSGVAQLGIRALCFSE